MTKSRIFLLLLAAFILGIAFRSFVGVFSEIISFGVVIGTAVIFIGFFRKHKITIFCGFMFLMFLLGLWRFNQIEEKTPDLRNILGQNIEVKGVIWEEPDVREDKILLKIKTKKIGEPFILITLRRYPLYKLGDELSMQGKIQKPTSSEDFDYKSYLARQDIFAVSYFPRVEKIGEEKVSRLRIILSKLKNSFEEKIDQALPEPHAAFLKGLLLGEKQSLPAELINDFKITGTTHVIALSGYNITIVGRFFIGLLSALSIPFFISFWLATLAIILFVVMTGASASVVRAAIMGILVLIARREGRLYSMTNALVLAGALMVWQNPRILRFDVSFQLSFLATVGLVYISPRIEKWWQKKFASPFSKIKPKEKSFNLRQTFIETISAQITVLPLLIYSFGQVSLISPVVNILVLAAVPYSMGLGFLTGMLGFISGILARVLGWGVWMLLEYKIRIIEIFAGLPYASLLLPSWMAWVILPVYGLVVWKIFKKEIQSKTDKVVF